LRRLRKVKMAQQEPQEQDTATAEEEEDDDEAEEAATPDEEAVETSLEEFLQRKERRAPAVTEEADEEEALLEAMEEREGRGTESLTVKVVPEQPNEFTCRSCFLVKHRSQLKDSKRMLCNDCA
jgi:hypothetical protein